MRTAPTLAAFAALFVQLLPGQLGRTGPPSAANPLARDQPAVEAGQNQFQQLCAGCHGRSGQGGQGEGQGPDLVNSWEVRRASDTELMNWIHNGVKGTAMPAFTLAPDQIRQLAAFVRSLNAPANSVPVQGSSANGESLFYAKAGCGACHMIRGRGGYLGPDLSNAGVEHRLSELRTAILNPAALSISGYRPILLAGGVRGVVKNESNWSLQVLDETGQIHLLHGAEMKTARLQSGSWMPADYVRRLAPNEIDDIVAFLSRQAVRVEEGDRQPQRPRGEPN
jgi:putative heme-binding domain-containing protein